MAAGQIQRGNRPKRYATCDAVVIRVLALRWRPAQATQESRPTIPGGPRMDDLPLPRLSEVAALAAALRGTVPPKATSFTRLVRCLLLSEGTVAAADMIFQERYGRDEKLGAVMKAAVAAGGLSNLVCAGAVRATGARVYRGREADQHRAQPDECQTHTVPRARGDVSPPSGTPAWVGEGAPKPASAMAFDASTALEPTKIAAIIVITRGARAPVEPIRRCRDSRRRDRGDQLDGGCALRFGHRRLERASRWHPRRRHARHLDGQHADCVGR